MTLEMAADIVNRLREFEAANFDDDDKLCPSLFNHFVEFFDIRGVDNLDAFFRMCGYKSKFDIREN